MSTTQPDDDSDDDILDGWSNLSDAEREALSAKFAAARARRAEGRGLPMDEVLPLYRQVG
jgi:hypothetical protein